jgi:hypothetical protein
MPVEIIVIQVYKSKAVFPKNRYTPQSRKSFHNTDAVIDSVQGFLENGVLILPLEYKSQVNPKNTELIIIQDILRDKTLENNRSNDMADSGDVFLLNQLNTPKEFEIFRVQKTDKDSYELFIDYNSNAGSIGVPRRENHKICDLQESKPIRFRTNGKSDFTLTGRKERTFNEFDYIIVRVGNASGVEFRERNKIHKRKNIPVKEAHLIDERKILK